MAVKPASEMDDDTFRKHLSARHATLADKLRRLEAMRGADVHQTARGFRALHRTEHARAAQGHTTGTMTEHEHSDD